MTTSEQLEQKQRALIAALDRLKKAQNSPPEIVINCMWDAFVCVAEQQVVMGDLMMQTIGFMHALYPGMKEAAAEPKEPK